MHDVTVRHATLDDAAALAVLAGQLGYPSTEPELRERLTHVFASPVDAVLVATIDDRIAGWIHVAEVVSVETEMFAEIRGLVVDESQRSRGIGATLVDTAERWACNRELSRIRVRSNVIRERTHAFYERLGYIVKKSQKAFDKSLR